MIQQLYKDIYKNELADGAILNERMFGFKEDYLLLHCLLRKYEPKSVFEIGTHLGHGTEIICNAVPRATVYSLDLPASMAIESLQHPLSCGKPPVGSECNLPFKQLFGNSMNFNYGQHPCEAYFIDGEHDEAHVFHETNEILKCNPLLVIYHDADMPEVFKGLMDAFTINSNYNTTNYEIYRVTDTRILYTVRK